VPAQAHLILGPLPIKAYALICHYSTIEIYINGFDILKRKIYKPQKRICCVFSRRRNNKYAKKKL